MIEVCLSCSDLRCKVVLPSYFVLPPLPQVFLPSFIEKLQVVDQSGVLFGSPYHPWLNVVVKLLKLSSWPNKLHNMISLHHLDGQGNSTLGPVFLLHCQIRLFSLCLDLWTSDFRTRLSKCLDLRIFDFEEKKLKVTRLKIFKQIYKTQL